MLSSTALSTIRGLACASRPCLPRRSGTRQDFYEFGTAALGLPEDQELVLHRAIAEEPLNIIAHVATTDAPFTDILTADYTVVDDILVNVWPVEAVAEQPAGLPDGQQLARYTDYRPSAGVLSTNTFFWRHQSTVENANRGRSNAISRAFLCEDYLDRPIDFPSDVNLTDTESIHRAIQENPGCQACHATLDPFASHLWGFMYLSDDVYGWLTYQPQNELMWVDETEAEPAFFGEPTGGTLSELAVAIANDERFASCMVRRVYEGLLDRPRSVEDDGQLALHREVYLGSGLSIKALFKSILRDPAYRGQTRTSSFGGNPAPTVVKLASPEQLTAVIADLTGYQLTVSGRAATEVDLIVRALAGGSDRGPAAFPSLGHSLVHRRIAEGAAAVLVEPPAGADAIASSRVGRILEDADLAAAPTDAVLVDLVREIRSQELMADDAEIAALQSLWTTVESDFDADDAWSALLTALLSDPELAVY